MRSLAGRMLRLARTIDVAGRVGEHQLGLLLRSVRGRGEALRIAQNGSRFSRRSARGDGRWRSGRFPGLWRRASVTPGDDLATLVDRASAAMSYEPSLPEARPSPPSPAAARIGVGHHRRVPGRDQSRRRASVRRARGRSRHRSPGRLPRARAVAAPAPRHARRRCVRRHDRRHAAREPGRSPHRPRDGRSACASRPRAHHCACTSRPRRGSSSTSGPSNT